MRSLPIPRLYSILHSRLLPLMMDQCDSRLTSMILLMIGLYESGKIHLHRIASKVPSRAKKLSTQKRLERFLSNQAVVVRDWYEPVARQLLAAAGAAGQIHLIIDSSKIGFGYQLLMVSVAYRRRSLPIAWAWIRHKRGHTTTAQQLSVLRYVHRLVPNTQRVSLVGDCEFGRPLLLEELDLWRWQYALRQPGDHLIWPNDAKDWLRLDWIHLRRGVPHWLPHTLLTAENAYPTQVVLYWAVGEKQPWFLATNVGCPRLAIQLYRRRMWIEEMFADLKSNGFDVEATRLRREDRLDRLTLAVCFLLVWFIALGEHVLCYGLSHLIDRNDRLDLSIFRLGSDFLDRCFTLDDPVPDLFIPNFCLVSGS